jgi:RNA polymerase sigma-70 factor (ECF subfamily)
MNRSFQEDRQLLSRCLAGSRSASENLVRRFSNLVYQSIQYTLISKHVSYNQQDLEDLHNTVFLRLFDRKCKRLRQYQGKRGCSVTTWIRMIAVRTVLDHLKKKGVDAIASKKDRIPLEKLPELKDGAKDILAEMETMDRNQLLQVAIKTLPPRDRLFMKLHFDQGLSMPEIAEIMQLSMGNIYTVKYRVIQKIKSYVSSQVNPDS